MPEVTLESIVVASPDQISADLGGDAAILQLKDGVYYSLDPVGARVWALLKEPRCVRDLETILLDEYDVGADQCRRDLFELLEKLLGAGLIQVSSPATPVREGVPTR
jgi:hypothetical protein